MKFKILHENRSRMRIHVAQARMTYEEADLLEYFLQTLDGVDNVKVHDVTCDAEFTYSGERAVILRSLQRFHYDEINPPEGLIEHSVRPLNAEFQDKLIWAVTKHLFCRYVLPTDIRKVVNWIRAVPYVWKGLKSLFQQGNLDVSVLDATAILASLLRKDYNTAGSVMFLLGIGDLLEEWTHKKSVGDLARVMSLNISEVWVRGGEADTLVPIGAVRPGDQVVVRTGNRIPFDGVVVSGEALVNQASLTGESLPVRKAGDAVVYAGTAVEEGELVFRVGETGGDSKYEQIVHMIEDSEALKSTVETSAFHMADRLVPLTLGTAALTYLLTQNVEKAVSVLMVDFSCALRLSMPIAVLSAMREAGRHRITIKGGSFLEQLSHADTIVFDKTGTLTKAQPRVRDVVSFNGMDPEELLRMAACLEEHYPHSLANAVVRAAQEKGLQHEEMHTEVEYVVAHGIASSIGGETRSHRELPLPV